MAAAGDLFGAAGMIRLVGGGYCRGGDPFGAAGGDLLEPQVGFPQVAIRRRWLAAAGGDPFETQVLRTQVAAAI
jgi:hypothetical protein